VKSKKKNPPFDLSVLNDYKNLKILVLGDVMLDHYIQAEVDRTSPEAPVAVATVRSEHYVPGGAANVALNLAAMRTKVFVAGVLGKDANAERLRNHLSNKKVHTSLLFKDPERPTTLKTRIISQGQQIIRIDREEKHTPPEKLNKKILDAIRKKCRNLNGVIISDYAKGVCSPELIQSVLTITRKNNIPVLCDPKGLDFTKYRGADILTPNFKEAAQAAGITAPDEKSLKKAARKILQTTRSKAIVITRGQKGVTLFQARKPLLHIPAHAREVYDVSGAGDTFISHFALAYFSGASLRRATELGNYASAIVVGKLGIAAVSPEELSSFIRTEIFTTKLKTLEDLQEITRRLKADRKKIVFTNGCFDLIHIGHIKFLQAARQLGDALIVGINTDASVKKVKGKGRPLISETERASLLSALPWVDYVVLFDETTPETLLKALKPDILVKGKNLKPREVVGHELVKSYGGEIKQLPFFSKVSTTQRLRSILSALKKQGFE